MKRLAAAVVLVVGFAVPAVAQTENVVQEPDRVVVKKHTVIDIDGIDINGKPDRPSELRIGAEYKPSFDSLVKKRVSFHTELSRSVDNL